LGRKAQNRSLYSPLALCSNGTILATVFLRSLQSGTETELRTAEPVLERELLKSLSTHGLRTETNQHRNRKRKLFFQPEIGAEACKIKSLRFPTQNHQPLKHAVRSSDRSTVRTLSKLREVKTRRTLLRPRQIITLILLRFYAAQLFSR